jgi:hypothetical protein
VGSTKLGSLSPSLIGCHEISPSWRLSRTIPASIVGPFTYNLVNGDYYDGTFQIVSNRGEASYGDLKIESLTVGPATPIPGTISLLATGLSALALLGWRRNRKAAAN